MQSDKGKINTYIFPIISDLKTMKNLSTLMIHLNGVNEMLFKIFFQLLNEIQDLRYLDIYFIVSNDEKSNFDCLFKKISGFTNMKVLKFSTNSKLGRRSITDSLRKLKFLYSIKMIFPRYDYDISPEYIQDYYNAFASLPYLRILSCNYVAFYSKNEPVFKNLEKFVCGDKGEGTKIARFPQLKEIYYNAYDYDETHIDDCLIFPCSSKGFYS